MTAKGASMAGGAEPDPGEPRKDRLAYMADLIRELEEMAERTAAPTLAGILHLAYSEALREQSRA